MPSEIVADIDGVLSNKADQEDALRGIFLAARNYIQLVTISEQLLDFGTKRSIGE